MNKRELFHNIVMLLLLLIILTGSYLIMLWRSYPDDQFLYILSNTLCASALVFLGGFLFLFPNTFQDRFIKESFLKKFMNEREKTGNIFKFHAHVIGAMFFFFGLIVILTLFLNSNISP